MPTVNSYPISQIHNETLCQVCGSPSSEWASFDDIHIFRCEECNHRFTDQSQLKELETYEDHYFDENGQNWNRYPDTNLFEFILERMKGNSVLDVGCGRGQFLKYVKEKSQITPTGTDLSDQHLGDIPLIKGDIANLPLSQTYDSVVSLAVIEHVPDVHKFVKTCASFLNPKGLLFIMTLDDQSILYKTARLLKHFGMSSPSRQLYSRHHLNHFSTQSLKKLMEIHSFQVIESRHKGIPLKKADVHHPVRLMERLMKLGVGLTFLLGALTGKTYLQTIVCKRI